MPPPQKLLLVLCVLLGLRSAAIGETTTTTPAAEPAYDRLIRILSQKHSLDDTRWISPGAEENDLDVLLFHADQTGRETLAQLETNFAWEDLGSGRYQFPGSLLVLSADGKTMLQRRLTDQQLRIWIRDGSPPPVQAPAPEKTPPTPEPPPPPANSTAKETAPPDARSFFKIGGTRWALRKGKETGLVVFHHDGSIELGSGVYERGRWSDHGNGHYQFLKQNFHLSADGSHLIQKDGFIWWRTETPPPRTDKSGKPPVAAVQYSYGQGAVYFNLQGGHQETPPQPSPFANTRWQNSGNPTETCEFHPNGTFALSHPGNSARGFWRHLAENRIEAYTAYYSLTFTLSDGQLSGDDQGRWTQLPATSNAPLPIPESITPLSMLIHKGGTRWSFQEGKENGLLEFYNDGTLRYGSGSREQGPWQDYGGNAVSFNQHEFRLSADCTALTQNNGRVWQRDEAPAKRTDATGTSPADTKVYALTAHGNSSSTVQESEPKPAPAPLVGTRWKIPGFTCEFLRNGTCVVIETATGQADSSVWRQVDDRSVEVYRPDNSSHTFTLTSRFLLTQTRPDGGTQQWSRDTSFRPPKK